MGGWFNDTQNPPMLEAECQKIISIWLIYIVYLKSIFEKVYLGGTLKWYQGIYVCKYIYIYI